MILCIGGSLFFLTENETVSSYSITSLIQYYSCFLQVALLVDDKLFQKYIALREKKGIYLVL